MRLVFPLLLLLLTACAPRPITVGSKNFTEQSILGEIIAQHLERELHVPIARKPDLGGTFVAQQALLTGAIDLYPEYTGTALASVLKQPLTSDPRAALDRVRAGYRPWNLEWTASLGFENTFAMAVRREDAQARHLTTLTDAARDPAPWHLGVGFEFEQRPDGLPGLQRAYHLPLAGPPKAMDLGLLYRALAGKQVDIVAGNSTDGALSVLPLQILQDDRHFFPPYEAAIVYRPTPALRDALKKLEGRITATTMRALNYQVDGRHNSPHDVAAAFLGK